MEKKGAIELSVGTIVILVIGMTMLVMGIVFVRTIFVGATDNVKEITDGVRNEINNLFADNERKIVIRLADGEATVKKGETFGIAYGIRNTVEGTSEVGSFTVAVSASQIEEKCTLTLDQANTFITLGKNRPAFELAPGGEPETFKVDITPPSNAPLCKIEYKIDVKMNNQYYDQDYFWINIIGK